MLINQVIVDSGILIVFLGIVTIVRVIVRRRKTARLELS